MDTHAWFRGLDERLRAWIHGCDRVAPGAGEAPMDNEDALKVYNAERCIECGCCVSGCATMANGKGFLGAAGLNRMARFMMDPRDTRKTSDYLEIVGQGENVFACFETMMCEDNCPLDLPVDLHMEYVREKVASWIPWEAVLISFQFVLPIALIPGWLRNTVLIRVSESPVFSRITATVTPFWLFRQPPPPFQTA